MFVASAYANPGADLDRIEEIIQEEISALVEEKPATEEELRRALRGWEMAFLENLEGLLSRAEQLQSYLHHVGRTDYLEEDLDRYRNVSSAEISEVVGTFLSADKKATLRVLPKAEETQEDGAEQ